MSERLIDEDEGIKERLKAKLLECREQRDNGGHFRRDATWVASWDGKAQGLEMALEIIKPDASASSSGDEPGYAPGDCSESTEFDPCLICGGTEANFDGFCVQCEVPLDLVQNAPADRPAAPAGTVRPIVGQCEDCAGTGWYGDNGPGIVGNAEFHRCECGANDKCEIGAHRYIVIDNVTWCETCNREADLSVCKMHHVLPCAHRSVVNCCPYRGYVECREVYYGVKCDCREASGPNAEAETSEGK